MTISDYIKSHHLSKSKLELIDELRRFSKEDDYIIGVLLECKSDSDAQRLLEYIRYGNDVCYENIILFALEIAQSSEEVSALQRIINEFTEKAKKESPEWEAKLTSIEFVYEGEEYCITAKHLGITDAQFECVQDEMAECLKQIGATSVRCDGFLD